LGNLKEKGQHWRSETVAELGGAILLECLGYSSESDRGGCFDYYPECFFIPSKLSDNQRFL
jgi:hypothetical protein